MHLKKKGFQSRVNIYFASFMARRTIKYQLYGTVFEVWIIAINATLLLVKYSETHSADVNVSDTSL